MSRKEEEVKYSIQNGKLFEDDPELGIRQVTHISRGSGLLEVRVNDDTIELCHLKKLRHEWSIDSDGVLSGTVGRLDAAGLLFDYVAFVYADTTEGKETYFGRNPAFDRILTLFSVGYVLDFSLMAIEKYTGRYGGGTRHRGDTYPRKIYGNVRPINEIYITHPTNEGFQRLILHRDGSLTRLSDEDFYIAPGDSVSFSTFINSVRLQTWKDKAYDILVPVIGYGVIAALVIGWIILARS